VLRQAQHERNINTLRQYPFVLSLSKGSCYEFIKIGLLTQATGGENGPLFPTDRISMTQD
jgi:hypothetical protein